MAITEKKAIEIIQAFLESRFPKTCYNCNHTFMSLKEYTQLTESIGKPVSYDAQQKKWKPLNPIGTVAMANCRCGSTLSLSSHGMPLLTMWTLLAWAKKESSNQHIEVSDLLDKVRTKIEQKVLTETDPKRIIS